jgi:SNF2 family DNA or RNA helicase
MALGTREEFLNRVEQLGSDATREIRDSISPLFWRIKKRELSLPRPKVTKVAVKLGDVQSAIYSALAAKVLADSHKAPKELLKLKQWRRARMVRLLQAASNPSLLAKYSHEFKLPALAASGLPVTELIDRYSDFEVPAKITQAVELLRKLLSQRRKVVIWTSFVHNIVTLLALLRDVSPLPLYGAIPASEKEDAETNRENIIDRFLHDASARVLIANPAACAESISLHTACHDAVYLDRTFNAAHFLQSKDRIHRVGLKPEDKINYYLLIAAHTIDEIVDMRLDEKQRRMLQLLETDLARVNLDSPEDVVSEDGEDEIDFRETLKQISRLSPP